MDAQTVLESLPITGWQGPFAAELSARALSALEDGRVLFLPALNFPLAPGEERFLSPDVTGRTRKNISFDPLTGRLANAAVTGVEQAALAAMLRRFAGAADRLLRDLVPFYAASLQQARTSFRPVEIAGRAVSLRHDDRRLHVDAFPARPLGGQRILRLFCNVASDGAPRAWRVGEPFAIHAGQFLSRLGRPVPGSAWLLMRLGLTKGRRTAYDHAMLRLHDAAKGHATYQATAPYASVAFPAGSTWICFTDQVVHAAVAGHCALEQTFHLPVTAMAEPDRAPLRILERLTGRTLV